MRIGALLALLFLSLAPVLAVDVDKCMEITQPGYYRLVNDILGLKGGKTYCIKISANDVVLDGQGFSISGEGSGDGIYVRASNVTIKNVKVLNYGTGIRLYSSSNITIIGNYITNNRYEGIKLSSSSSNTITVNNITNNYGEGIELSSSSSNTISENNIMNNDEEGIELSYSKNNTISGNNIANNEYSGIELSSSSSNTISENNIINNGRTGIYLSSSPSNIITGNTIVNNKDRGIYLYSSSYNLIYNNLFNNTRNYYISDSTNNVWNTTLQQGRNIPGGNLLGGNAWLKPDGTGYSQTCKDTEEPIEICDEPYTLASDNVDYLPLSTRTPTPPTDISQCTEITKSGYYKLNKSISGLLSGKDYCIKISADNVVLDGQGFSITGTGSGKGIFVQANNVTIKNVSVSGYYDGIFLSLSSNNTIENCTLSGNYEEGIHLYSSNNNIIRSNKVSGNVRGIYLHSSSNNLMENNMISNNNDYGIHLSSSSDNIVKNNDFTNCGLVVYDSYNNRVENNYVNGKPLVYLENASNRIISNAGQVILVNSNNITVRDLVISNATIGIELWNSSDIRIMNNNISNNEGGIVLAYSSNNTIASNSISNNNRAGIYPYYSSNNLIYNNLFNNTNNFEIYDSTSTWNTTLRQGRNILGGNWLGGNAWLSPDGTGFSQICSDSNADGICDSPYVIDDRNRDYLPLKYPQPQNIGTEPWQSYDSNGNGKIEDQELIAAIMDWLNNRISDLELINVIMKWLSG
ncbi:MAG: NosD domain-containing protein [Archaeoglobaceae archaeon]